MEFPGTARFAGFKLDPSARRLTRRGREIHLTPKEFDLLLLLVEHSGSAVSKDDIHHLVWHDTAVEEGSLTQAVSLLRKALAAYPGGSACIETIARYGYRFSLPVHWEVPADSRRLGRIWLWIAAVAAMLSLFASLWWVHLHWAVPR